MSVWLLRKQHVGQVANLPSVAAAGPGNLGPTVKFKQAFTKGFHAALLELHDEVALGHRPRLCRRCPAGHVPDRPAARHRDLSAGRCRPISVSAQGPRWHAHRANRGDYPAEALDFIGKEVGPENVEISLGYVGVVHSSYPINTVYLWMGGPEEAVIRVALKRGSERMEDLKVRLRKKLGPHLREWVTRKWLEEGESAEKVARTVSNLRLSFEPADIVNEVLSFGSPTPIEGSWSAVPEHGGQSQPFAAKLFTELDKVPSLTDLQYGQSLDYPTYEVRVDRLKAAQSEVTVEELARSLLAQTSSSRFVVPNYWRDPASGIGYQVQVEVPQAL